MSEIKIYRHNQPLPLENGSVLPNLEIAYQTWGVRAPDDSNVVWVCHALTANSDVLDWWAGLFGPGCLFDPARYFIVCANNLGSCYGTTGPLSLNPPQGAPYYHEFPDITIRDMVQVHETLRRHLGIRRINVLIGGSQGGQQALEWAIRQPDLAGNLVLIATNAVHSPWGVAFNESQRLAIATDPTWPEHSANAGLQGMKTARSIALLSYRHYHTYRQGQQPATNDLLDHFPAASYQRYQGEKLAKRFNAFSYWALSKAMDTHNVGRGRASVEAALGAVEARSLVVSITSDILFPPEEQRFLARHIPNAWWREIDSLYGHDGFLTETRALGKVLEEFLYAKPPVESWSGVLAQTRQPGAALPGLKHRIW
ncbi:MAG: homoserine O-acetyltransferase [Saprospiraceae bacterium]|jgi:homoserine O-acetyltransferase|nr:homoserine O-acetyltransferase [Saprospiraceae bacterium]